MRYLKQLKEPSRIISQLSLLIDSPILPGETLLIFDEIQECNPALNALKYFYEDASEYAVVAAGSLLGVALSKGDSFPVGKVEFLNLYPLTFKEFLKTINENYIAILKNLLKSLLYHNSLLTGLVNCINNTWSLVECPP